MAEPDCFTEFGKITSFRPFRRPCLAASEQACLRFFSAMTQSVERSIDAMEDAFFRAVFVTLAGSMTRGDEVFVGVRLGVVAEAVSALP